MADPARIMRVRSAFAEWGEELGLRFPELTDNEGWRRAARTLAGLLDGAKEALREAFREHRAWWGAVRAAFGATRIRRAALGEMKFGVPAMGRERRGVWECAETENTSGACLSCPRLFEGALPAGERKEVPAYCVRAGCMCILKLSEE